MSIKIAHVSDIHVRKLKYHKEYRAVFEQLYEKLREEKPDIIVNTGDTFHTKLDLSPEAIRMMSELFVGLADIAPYHMILGNHDMNLKNSGRLDAISPIVDYLQHPNIHFHKHASVVEVADGIDLHVLSIVDPENWQKELPEDRINIALYHGSVVGSVTDTGWMMTHGDISLNELEKYDYAMLGDITIAEKGATIGFAGKRVIQDTIREELPIDFQKAEYLKEHGMVDIVSHRKDLKETLHKVLQHISH